MDIHNEVSSDFSNREITPKYMKVKEERQGLDETKSVNQNIAVDYSAETCNLDLVLGIASQAEIKLEADCGRQGKQNQRMNTVYTSDCLLLNEPSQLKNSVSPIFPIVDYQDMHLKSSFCYSTSPKLTGSLSPNSSSPESILRISATFKNTPSIIKKRSYKKIWNDNFSDAAFSPVRTFSCFNWEEVNGTY
ncbi:hypothetical protein CRYUN_Cryun13aG0121500 [Craigia yunnanensis]